MSYQNKKPGFFPLLYYDDLCHKLVPGGSYGQKTVAGFVPALCFHGLWFVVFPVCHVGLAAD